MLGVSLYERSEARRGHRNGTKTRTLTGLTGPLELTLPRAALFTPSGPREWASKLCRAYQRRSAEVNEAVASAYLTGANTRRIQGALRPLLKAAPLSKSAVSRVVGTLRSAWEAWTKRSLADLDVAYLYLDGLALGTQRRQGTSVPVLAAVAVLADGQKQLLALEMCGSESNEAWKGFLDDLVERGLKAPLLCIIDGNAGLRRALARLGQDAGAAMLRAQAAQPGAQGAGARARGRSPTTSTASSTRPARARRASRTATSPASGSRVALASCAASRKRANRA